MAKRKLVLEESDGSVIMGIMQPDADPVVETVEGSMEDALDRVPALLTRAQEKWAESPRNPKYVPPKAPAKARTAPAATPAAQTPAAAALPLLANTGDAPAAVPEPAAEPAAEATVLTGEAASEALATDVAADAATEPATEPATEAATEAATEEAVTEAAAEAATEEVAEKPAEVPAAPATNGWEYMLKDGRGPYADIQAAMDALSMDAQDRPHHNRWDRLSTDLKDRIPRRPKES